jgi:hypothetical protein
MRKKIDDRILLRLYQIVEDKNWLDKITGNQVRRCSWGSQIPNRHFARKYLKFLKNHTISANRSEKSKKYWRRRKKWSSQISRWNGKIDWMNIENDTRKWKIKNA